MTRSVLKDDHLADLARNHNVARFASFESGNPTVRHAYIEAGQAYNNLESALRALFAVAPTVNVRVFSTAPLKSAPFEYGVKSVEDAAAMVRSFAADGLHTIVNETIDVNDGGVSGVSLGGVMEFSPKDTPRAVEKPGVVTVSRELGLRILDVVYGVKPEIPWASDLRVEFSLHPRPVGFRQGHTILWERESIQALSLPWHLKWPNNFSRFIGDKAFGLLVAHLLGVRVPETSVFGRNVAPFRFGQRPDSARVWLRTCPSEQMPGKFPTFDSWHDPFALLGDLDPEGTKIVSVLAQNGVSAVYSGASLPVGDGRDEVQGVEGSGERFMLGEDEPISLPHEVVADVQEVIARLRSQLGPVRIEWAHDGKNAWVLQLHTFENVAGGNVIFPGDPAHWVDFDPKDGLETLRLVAAEASKSGAGVRVVRPIGTTSHVGDILRKARIPARIVASSAGE